MNIGRATVGNLNVITLTDEELRVVSELVLDLSYPPPRVGHEYEDYFQQRSEVRLAHPFTYHFQEYIGGGD